MYKNKWAAQFSRSTFFSFQNPKQQRGQKYHPKIHNTIHNTFTKIL